MSTDPTAALAAKRRQVEAQMAAISDRPTDVGGISFGKRVGEGTSEAVDRLAAVPAHATLQDLLDEVVRAEAKVVEGTYGRCDVCGSDIGAGRLEARPWATRCLAHA